MEMSRQKLSILELHLSKILVVLLMAWICLVPTVKALGVGPLQLDLSVEKGKETIFAEYIGVLNPEPYPIRVIVSVTGPISEFVTVEPSDFTMPAGPGMESSAARPRQTVKVTFTIPRELPESSYKGEILFTQQPIEGGVLGAAVQLGVKVDLDIGKMAKAQFPTYITGLTIVLIIVLISSIVVSVMRRYRE